MKKWRADVADAWQWVWRAYRDDWVALGVVVIVGSLVFACQPDGSRQTSESERLASQREYETSLRKVDAFRYFAHPETELCFVRNGSWLRGHIECDERVMIAVREDELRVSERSQLEALLSSMRFFSAIAVDKCFVRDGNDHVASVPCTVSVRMMIDRDRGIEPLPPPPVPPPAPPAPEDVAPPEVGTSSSDSAAGVPGTEGAPR